MAAIEHDSRPTREEIEGIRDCISVASRMGSSYEIYGGVTIAEAVGRAEAALDRLLGPKSESEAGRSPEEIAEGAMDRLCAFDATVENPEWATTAQRIADFQRTFAMISAERLASAARRTKS